MIRTYMKFVIIFRNHINENDDLFTTQETSLSNHNELFKEYPISALI